MLHRYARAKLDAQFLPLSVSHLEIWNVLFLSQATIGGPVALDENKRFLRLRFTVDSQPDHWFFKDLEWAWAMTGDQGRLQTGCNTATAMEKDMEISLQASTL